ncbi:hypothetical protein POTOM_034174 [Populus tomentosa]|uniref:Bifunctional inhibitor/plant lipid transfer protein/seed storage helical domain-containing protein n=1 Tax=Populus tomentosa TaxID=118781 RepID=A0A8X8CFW6_POPTO|nr:hypothetical protein POTOM_034174 [Populus tomentosa]
MATTATHRHHVLALAMLVIVGIHILGNQKVAAASCKETMSSLVSKCSRFVGIPGPREPPSDACCQAMKQVTVGDLPCLCKFVTPAALKVISMEKAVFVARTCGLTVPAGTICHNSQAIFKINPSLEQSVAYRPNCERNGNHCYSSSSCIGPGNVGDRRNPYSGQPKGGSLMPRNSPPLISKCTRFVRIPGPKVPPSDACCQAVKQVPLGDLPCLCKLVTPAVEKAISMEKAVYVARTCGLPIPPGLTVCGSKSISTV